jgi:amino acid transporter
MSETAPAPPAAPQLYTRRSSGLVREISPASAVIGSLGVLNLTIAAVTLVTLPFTFPGANMILAVLISLVPAAILGGVYVLFGVAMPRSGGDYVFNSRALHPSIGFASNFNLALWNFVFIGIYANWFSTIGLAGLFGSIGTITGDKGWDTAAADMSKHWVAFLIGAFLCIVIVLLCTRLRLALRVMKILFACSLIGILVSIIGTLLVSHASFVHDVNKLSSYNGIIHTAAKNGFTTPHSWHEFGPTLSGVALVALSTLFVMYATYTGGEVKDVRRSIPASIYGTLAVGGIVFALMAVAAAKTFGTQFVGATQAVSYTSSYPFATAPYFNFLASIAVHSTIYAFVVNAGFALMVIVGMIFSVLTMTRCVFAWAMDRLLPDPVAAVSPRTHAPNLALAVGLVASLGGLAVFTFTTFSDDVGGTTLGFLTTFLATSVAAMVFPYRRKDLYEQSPLKPRIFGLPLLSVMGVVSFIVIGAIALAYFTNNHFGANGTRDYIVFLGAWAVGLVYYFVVRFYRMRTGVPLDLAATSLPPD